MARTWALGVVIESLPESTLETSEDSPYLFKILSVVFSITSIGKHPNESVLKPFLTICTYFSEMLSRNFCCWL